MTSKIMKCAELDSMGFNHYRKKPILVHAKQQMNDFIVNTKEGLMKGKRGDYLVRGIEGEMYPCKKRIFNKTYTLIN